MLSLDAMGQANILSAEHAEDSASEDKVAEEVGDDLDLEAELEQSLARPAAKPKASAMPAASGLLGMLILPVMGSLPPGLIC